MRLRAWRGAHRDERNNSRERKKKERRKEGMGGKGKKNRNENERGGKGLKKDGRGGDGKGRNCENRSPIKISIAFRPLGTINFRVEHCSCYSRGDKRDPGCLLHAKRRGERGMKVAGRTQREKLHGSQW